MMIEIAERVRELLLEEFPYSPNLERQCKRSSILLDLVRKKEGLEGYIEAGHVIKRDRDYGHTWNIIVIEGEEYVLDASLTQFQEEMEEEVPSIVCGMKKDVYKQYGYLPDGRGKYEYHKDDVRKSLRQKAGVEQT
ncbi:hypothetical protein IMZ31_22165 (plasmid) [Pontibacillus sp. ALD_SL1]|uniref:hypothetical protein n=1 Tax=Pontibacillus sp. ALD_SL1 TaxID=2777185 RepID=UPI001A97CD3C|nr:hypothetical protein [Pontibacillus sp. ALD_SL1]QST02160.1 hypothetical protein IMZ31_22165 [Pontibacillus sp. ALD_SL1]